MLIGSTRPDKIEVRKALRDWFDRSWFLDQSQDADVKPESGQKSPPATWRLGSRPNLKQMHAAAVQAVRRPSSMLGCSTSVDGSNAAICRRSKFRISQREPRPVSFAAPMPPHASRCGLSSASCAVRI